MLKATFLVSLTHLAYSATYHILLSAN